MKTELMKYRVLLDKICCLVGQIQLLLELLFINQVFRKKVS